MKKKLKMLSLAAGMLAVGATSTSEAALISVFAVNNFQPAISNVDDMFTIYSSPNVGKHGWNAGFYIDYAKNPLEFGAPPGNRIAGVVDNQLIANFYATYGITEWMSFGLNIPVAFWNDVRPLVAKGPNALFEADFDPQTNLGDIRMEFKFRLRDNSDESGKLIGVALIPFATLPTGPSSTFMGNGAVTGGGKVVLDFNISERVRVALNVGYLSRDRVQVLNVDYDDQILMGLGISVDILKDRLTFIAEGSTEPVVRHFFDDEVHTPAQAQAGLRFHINENFAINVGGGAGLTIGVGSPDYRIFAGLNYNWAPKPVDCPKCPETTTTQAPEIEIMQKVHFDFNRATIKKVSYPVLNDVVAIIKSNPDAVRSVSIQGHTDAIGSDEYNQSLSERRANAVKEYLINQGVSAGMLNSVGYGESQPIDTNESAAGRANNRRVEFKVNQ